MLIEIVVAAILISNPAGLVDAVHTLDPVAHFVQVDALSLGLLLGGLHLGRLAIGGAGVIVDVIVDVIVEN